MARRKRSPLNRYSLAQLQSLIDEQRSTIASRRAELVAEISELDAQLAGTNGTLRRGRKPGKRGRTAAATSKVAGKSRRKKLGSPRGDDALPAVIRRVLGAAKEPVRLKDLAEQVKAAGYSTKSKSFAVIVGQRLSEMRDVKKAGRGLYALKG